MTAEKLWRSFCAECNMDEAMPYEAWAFGGAPDELAALTLAGIKTATASAYDLYALDHEPVPQVGEYSVLLDSRDEALCVLRDTKVYVAPFREVREEQAYKEGEGDRSLSYWRQVHRDFFTQELAEYGLSFSEEMPVLCEEFEVVWPKKAGL